MTYRPTPVERILELARSGRYRNSSEIAEEMMKEGAERAHEHFAGSFRLQVNSIAQEAWQTKAYRAIRPKSE
jgi:hypothetical protein